MVLPVNTEFKMSNNQTIAEFINEQRSSCTFTSLVYTAKGKTTGKGEDRKFRGRHKKLHVILTGFSYENFVKRNLAALNGLESGVIMAKMINDAEITPAVVDIAREALRASYQRTLDGESVWTATDAFEIVTIDGKAVKGTKKYVGENQTAPDGTIYLNGLAVSSTLIEADINGNLPATKSRPDVRVKGVIERLTGANRFRTFKLQSGGEWTLKLGGCETLADL